MQRADNVRPVIIRRKKVSGGDGHHGGAWKVAYADFVTAMMAFFLMLWLLGSVEEEKRKGIADYFSPTLSINSHSAGADGFLAGVSVSEMASLDDKIAQRGRSDLDVTLLHDLARKIEEWMSDTALSEALAEQILIRLTEQGLELEIFDLPQRPIFDPHTATPAPVLLAIAQIVSQVTDMVTNPLAISVHVATLPAVVRENTVWPQSVTRTQAMRDLLVSQGVADRRINRLQAHADRDPVSPDPMAVRNNRVVMTFLRNP